MEVVDDCPDTKEKWREASARKNCSAYASQCDEPDRLVYHCVINAFVNETLEVCAYSRIIVLGVCPEYSVSGNRVQQNKINCSDNGPTSCPTGYISTDAYKYPVCYKVAKENRRKEELRRNKTDTFSTKNSTQNGKSGGKYKSTENISVAIVISVAVLLVVVIVILKVTLVLLKRKDPQQNDDHHRVEYPAPNDREETEDNQTAIYFASND